MPAAVSIEPVYSPGCSQYGRGSRMTIFTSVLIQLDSSSSAASRSACGGDTHQ